MNVRDWCAIAGLAYGVLSDSLGENKQIKENSLVGLVVGRFKVLMGYEPREKPETCSKKAPSQEAINAAHLRKKRLLEDPRVESVETNLYGKQIVLTVVRRK